MLTELVIKNLLEYLVSGNTYAYPDTIPREANYPAIAFEQINSGFGNRDISGKAAAKHSTWRATVFAKNRKDRDLIISQLEQMDGLRNNHFSLVMVESVNNGPVNNLQDFYTRNIDFKVNMRRLS